MRLYLMRHGEAEPAGERPLTALGRQQVEKVARAAGRAGAKPVRIFQSGILRAQQTAEILIQTLGLTEAPRKIAGLNPNDDPDTAMELLENLTVDVALVGHLPHVEALASLLILDDSSRALLLFPTAGMACLERNPTTERWLIRWMITPDTSG